MQNLIEMDKSSKFSKKVNKLKLTMDAAKNNMMNGAMMGFMVGGLFGLIIGIWSAVQTRRLAAIPISVLASGGSFGFILGCGSVLRSDTMLSQEERLMKKCKKNSYQKNNNKNVINSSRKFKRITKIRQD